MPRLTVFKVSFSEAKENAKKKRSLLLLLV